mgnify:FL=1
MLVLGLLACAPAMLRPAHSLGLFQGAANLGAFVQPLGDEQYPGDCAPGQLDCDFVAFPVQLEFRVGLGRGWEIGVRGLTPPRAVDLKWSFLDERRHDTPVSLALDAEFSVDLDLRVTLRGQVLGSSTLPLGDKVALRPALNAGWWKEPTPGDDDAHGPGGLLGVYLPVLFLDDQSIAPYVATAAYQPLGSRAVWTVWAGVELGPWLQWTGADGEE